MKVVILAGGLPSTLKQDEKIPKPMAEIGGRPILWHIMKQYAYYGYTEFIICTGYKGEMIKDYFMNFYIYQSDITVDLQTNQVEVHRKKTESWDVIVADTGRDASASERILSVREYLKRDTFLVTYGDCVSDMDISDMVAQHKKEGKLATFAVANPTGRNKIIPVGHNGVIKRSGMGDNSPNAWVTACSMVFEQGVFQYLKGDEALLEEEMLNRLSAEGGTSLYCHNGFWTPMETVRDKTLLESMWKQGKAPWKVWED